jgi:hypothetical protein
MNRTRRPGQAGSAWFLALGVAFHVMQGARSAMDN